MKEVGKIVGINLGILVAYSMLLKLVIGRDGITIMMYSAFFIFCQFLGNLLAGISARSSNEEKRKTSGSYILSAFVVLLVGFGLCMGNASL